MNPRHFVDGQPDAGVDPADRGLAYGDGVFETMACRGGRIRRLEYHLDRVIHGCARLAIPAPDRAGLRAEIESACPAAEPAVVKLIVTRGSGARGYAVPEPAVPRRIVSISPWPDPPRSLYTRGVSVRTCALRLGENPQLAGIKHLSRLEQVLARMELIGTGAHEGLLRSTSGALVSGTSSNVFAVDGGRLLTPRLERCGVHGVMRRIVLERAGEVGLQGLETEMTADALPGCDELFVTNAVLGIRPVAELDGHAFAVGAKTLALMERLNDA